MSKLKASLLILLLSCLSLNTSVMAHDGTPNMAFVWRDGQIIVDTQRQGRSLGDFTAFVIDFQGSLTPYRTSDAGFAGQFFDQGGTIFYRFESTLLKWDPERARWLREGFDEQLLVIRVSITQHVSATEGEGTQSIVAPLAGAGSMHVHPTFEFKKTDGTAPDDGAYLVAITLFGMDDMGERIIYQPSRPFFLAFHLNVGGTFDLTAFNQALNEFPGITLNDYERINPLFDWAEEAYGQFFPHPEQSRFVFGFYARCYDNKICLGGKNGKVFATGGVFGGLSDLGLQESYFEDAGL